MGKTLIAKGPIGERAGGGASQDKAAPGVPVTQQDHERKLRRRLAAFRGQRSQRDGTLGALLNPCVLRGGGQDFRREAALRKTGTVQLKRSRHTKGKDAVGLSAESAKILLIGKTANQKGRRNRLATDCQLLSSLVKSEVPVDAKTRVQQEGLGGKRLRSKKDLQMIPLLPDDGLVAAGGQNQAVSRLQEAINLAQP